MIGTIQGGLAGALIAAVLLGSSGTALAGTARQNYVNAISHRVMPLVSQAQTDLSIMMSDAKANDLSSVADDTSQARKTAYRILSALYRLHPPAGFGTFHRTLIAAFQLYNRAMADAHAGAVQNSANLFSRAGRELRNFARTLRRADAMMKHLPH